MSTTERSASNASTRKKVPAPTSGDEIAEAIEVINRQRLQAIDRRGMARLSRAVLDAIGESGSTLTIIIIRDRQMRRLNHEWRGIDQPTDVLSFAYLETDEEQDGPDLSAVTGRNLGDLVISVETAARYAAKYGISFEREIDQLVIHGTLHLAGYDHETDQGQMNRLEKRLRRQLLPESSSPVTDQPRQPRR
jgi:probable rRNA maturation factor